MEIDLSSNKLFFADSISLDKNLNFIYGKNGTGKSTLTKLMLQKDGNESLKIFSFQGFDSVIGENALLNAIVLGESNKSIEAQIAQKKKTREELQQKVKDKNKEIEPSIEGSKGEKRNKVKNKLDSLKSQEEQFFTNLAKEIIKLHEGKLVKNPRAYNRSNVKIEKTDAELLDKSEVEKLEQTLDITKTDKVASITIPKIKLAHEFVEAVNQVLVKSAQERTVLHIESDRERDYLEIGVELHGPGDNCKFCGNKITEERYFNIKSYFDADEVKSIKNECESLKEVIEKQVSILKGLDNAEFLEVQDTLKERIEEKVQLLKGNIAQSIMDFETLKQALVNKNPFESINPVSLGEAVNLEPIISEINSEITEFNELLDDLNSQQEKAQLELRKHYIANLLSQAEYKSIVQEIGDYTSDLNQVEQEIAEVEKDIQKLKFDISQLDESISLLLAKTQSTGILVQNINKKLEGVTNFRLVLRESKQNGMEYYEITNSTGEIRPITQLSTGEKNLIAFLYFLESLDSLENRDKRKVIIFDDPMNSNDDTVQYFILEELNKVIKRVKKNSEDIFVLLTHNVFFYQGLIHELVHQRDSDSKPYEKNNFYKLLKSGDTVQIIHIEKEADDFLNSYDGLWYELAFLYKMDKPRLMLNPIRRIVETFIIFNGVDGFYQKSKDAKRLFNVNSHGNIEFEVDIIGLGREELIERMKRLFRDNQYEPHFNKHWKHWCKHCTIDEE